MRIAIVSQPYYPQAGGVSEHAHHTAVELRKLGHEVDVITSRFRGHETDGDGVYRLGRNVLVPHLGAFSNVNADLGVRRDLDRLFRRNGYDIVHVHEPLSPTLPLAAIATCPEDAALVGTFHASASRGIAYRVFRRLLRPYAERLDARIAVSHAARRFVSRYIDGDYAIIPNGVDPARFHPKVAPLAGLESDRPTILFVGRFYPRKGFHVLLGALPRVAELVPDVRLLVVGDGPLRPWYRAQAKRAPCDVTFLGELSPAEIPSAYRTADVFVAPSTGQESFGIIHLEAMASGCPIVASDIEGYREILDPGREALLFPNGDTEALAASIVRVLTSVRLAREMALAGRMKAERYSWSRVVRELDAVFAESIRRIVRISLAS